MSLRKAANRAGIHLADGPVTANGRVELLHYHKEQTISRTLHRFGNLAGVESQAIGTFPYPEKDYTNTKTY